jgi:N-acetylmuramoyl-L-alanine amidase
VPASSSPEAAPARPARRTSTGAQSLTRALGLKLRRVVLDPGHGGHDTGTVGRSGLMEKDLVLDIAKRLGSLLEERMGSEVIYTRESDVFVPLEQRTQIANDHRADLFLSIHVNSSPSRAVAGVETYFLSFTSSQADLAVAARENATSSQSIHELSDLVRKIAMNDKIEESRELATYVQTSAHSLAAQVHGKALRNRGVKKAPFVVLIGAQMPSALVEIGFLSNARDEVHFMRDAHRRKIAEALYEGISRYANSLSGYQVAHSPPGASAKGQED